MKKSVVYYLIYLGFLTYFEVILRIFTLKSSMDGIPFILNFWFALILTIITLAFKPTRTVLFSCLFLLTCVLCSQVYYFYFFDTFYVAYSFLRVGMVAESYYREILTLIQENNHILFLYFTPLIGLFFFRKKLTAPRLPFRKVLIGIVVFAVLVGGTLFQITMRNKDDATYDAFVYHPEALSSVKALGVLTSFTVDTTRLVREKLGLVNASRVPDIIDDGDDTTPTPFSHNVQEIPFDTMMQRQLIKH